MDENRLFINLTELAIRFNSTKKTKKLAKLLSESEENKIILEHEANFNSLKIHFQKFAESLEILDAAEIEVNIN